MDYNHSNNSERQLRPRTPPLPPSSKRSRSRSRSPRRRYRLSPAQYDSNHRSRDRHIDIYDDHGRNSNSRARPQQSRCIGIFGLSERTSESDIRRIFSKYGYIENATLIMDNKTRRSRGYCFVYFEALKSAIRAVESSSNMRIDNRYVRVDFSITSRPRSPGSIDRFKDDIKYHRNGSRFRSNRRDYSPSTPPKRYYH